MTGGSGYGPYLAARPQTLGHAFTDSLVELAYLVERFHEFGGWPGVKPDADELIDRDLVLTNASVYWLTATGASSSRASYEGAAGMPIDQDAVPTGVSHGGPGIFRRIAARRNHLVHWGDHTSPSHMVAMAAPDNLIADLGAFFALVR